MRKKVLNTTTPNVATPSQPVVGTMLSFQSGQIININKPAGWTSFDVVRRIRQAIKVKKVGHAGTLDPFATGVLLVCTGKATKRVNELMHLEKEYRADIELGKTTDTYDCTGKVTSHHTTEAVTESRIRDVCQEFVGEIEQVPPMYSAIKQNGTRLYELARRGVTVERAPRRVCIYELNILKIDLPIVSIEVVCSKGTYIRALANDIGGKLDCGGYLGSLCRTRIGSYKVEDAETITSFTETYGCFD